MLLEDANPHIVLVEAHLPDLKGYEIIASARLRGSAARFVAYSAHEEYIDVMGFVRAGAAGYISKDETIENLIRGVKSIAHGGTWYSQRIAHKLGEWVQTVSLPMERLTPQETNVLRLLAHGKTDAEILTELRIASRTLRHHLQNAMAKIGVQERTQALLWALEHDLGKEDLRKDQGTYATHGK